MFFTENKKGFLINIDTIPFYIQKYNITGVRNFSEQSTISGNTIFTNCNLRAKKLIVNGVFFRSESPSELFYQLDKALCNDKIFSFSFAGMKFSNCHLYQYAGEEDGTDMLLPFKLEFLVVDAIERDVNQ